jgi:hypothetical protein
VAARTLGEGFYVMDRGMLRGIKERAEEVGR